VNEQAFLGVTESEYTGGGPGEGSYRMHRLLRDTDVVVSVPSDDGIMIPRTDLIIRIAG
jgi:cell division control protein 6